MSEYRLKSIELCHFVGMELGGITRFKMSPKQDKIVILGSNGAGKSRLLRTIPPHALSPLDLLDGGYGVWNYTVGVDEYLFEQRKKGKALRCSIYKNGKVLVEHANPTVYNDTVSTIFGYDRKTKDLLTSTIKFHQMSTPERRYWFGQLATSDLSTALAYYKYAKELQRDNSGAIKVSERYISDMKPLVLKDCDELNSLNTRLKELEVEYEEVNSEWMKYHGSEGKLDETLNEIELISGKIHTMNLVDIQDSQHYLNLISKYTAQRDHHINYVIPRINSELTNLDNELKEAEFYAKNLDVYEERITDIKNKLMKHRNSDNIFVSELISLDLLTLRNIRESSTRTLTELLRVQEAQTSDDKLSELNARLEEKRNVLDTLLSAQMRDKNVLSNIEGLIHRHNHTEDVDCPECKVRFKPGISHRIEALEESASRGRVTIANREADITKARADYDEILHTVNMKNELIEVVKRLQSGHLFTSLINHLLTANGLTRATNLTMWFDEYTNATDNVIKILELGAELADLETKQLVAVAATGRDRNAVSNKINELSDSLRDEKESVEKLTSLINGYKTSYSKAMECETLGGRLKTLMSGLDVVVSNQSNFYYCEFLSKTKDNLWGLISGIRERKATLDKMREELEYNEVKLNELREKKGYYDDVVKELSPSDGILAEYLYRSIYSVTDSMNLLIEQVFNYPLVIKPCDVEDGELDYTFPFVEGDSGTTRRDVSIGSDAQKELFDVTFLLSAIQAMGIRHQPLLLDEPGRTMDVGHKNMHSDFIASLCDTEYCSQLFVVSHNKEFHSRLGAVDYVVLRDDGVDLPDVYNECVEIEYGN